MTDDTIRDPQDGRDDDLTREPSCDDQAPPEQEPEPSGDAEFSDPEHIGSGDFRVDVWLLEPGGVTGAYLGGAVLTRKDFVMLHPGAARAALAAGPPPRLRVTADTRWERYVTDGSVMRSDSEFSDALLAVELDWPIAEEVTPLPVDPRHIDADRLEQWLAELESEAPTDVPEPPEKPGYERRQRPPMLDVSANRSRGKPWWCRVWPGCRGC